MSVCPNCKTVTVGDPAKYELCDECKHPLVKIRELEAKLAAAESLCRDEQQSCDFYKRRCEELRRREVRNERN